MIRIPAITGDLARIPQANAQATGGLAPVPIDVELLVLEQFPPEIRHALNDAAIKVNCLALVPYFNWATRQGFGPEKTLRKFRETEANEIAVFAGQHRAQYGYALPHVAAGATVQRYGTLGPSRHAPKRVGKPIMRRRVRRR